MIKLPWRWKQLHVVYPIVLACCFLLDGVLPMLLSQQLMVFPWRILPLLPLIWLFYAIVFDYGQRLPMLAYAIATGLLFDVYYTTTIGQYTFAFWASYEVMRRCHQWLEEHLLSSLLLLLLGMLTFLLISYVAGMISTRQSSQLSSFMVYQLLPTLVLNLVIALFGYLPVGAWLKRLL